MIKLLIVVAIWFVSVLSVVYCFLGGIIGSPIRYVSDGIRKEYYLQVAFENGNVETLHVSPSTYNKTKTGRPKILTLQKGLFGLPVITKGL